MQDDRRPERLRQSPHPLGTPLPLTPRLQIRLAPLAEHVQIMAPQHENALVAATKEVRLQVRFLNQRPFLPGHRVGLSSPLHRLTAFDIDDRHKLCVRTACLPVHLPLATSVREIDPERQEFRPPARRIEHVRRQYLIDRFPGMPDKSLEVLRPGGPSALPIPVVRKRRLDEPARSHPEQSVARPTVVPKRSKQHPSRPSEVFSARLRERAAVDHHARNRNIAFRHRHVPFLPIRPGPGARAHLDRPSPSTDRDIDLPKPLALDTAKHQAQQHRPRSSAGNPSRSSARASARSPSPPAPWPDFRQILKPRGDFVWRQEHRLVRLPRLERPTQK